MGEALKRYTRALGPICSILFVFLVDMYYDCRISAKHHIKWFSVNLEEMKQDLGNCSHEALIEMLEYTRKKKVIDYKLLPGNAKALVEIRWSNVNKIM